MSKSRDIADSAATINYIDGLTSDAQTQLNTKAVYPSQTGNSGKFLTTDGSTTSWAAAGGATDYQEFTSSGTWTKPAGINYVLVEIVGGGGGGSWNNGTADQQGGGGGEGLQKLFRASVLGSTETVTIGSGGAGGYDSGVTATEHGQDGGDSSFGSHVTAKGGKGGNKDINNAELYIKDGYGNSGSGAKSIQDQEFAGTSYSSYGESNYGGGGGGAGSNGVGGNAVFGGAGGGGQRSNSTNSGGTSTFGGNGGASNNAGNGGDGAVPGGGGGSCYFFSQYTGGDGGNGRIRIWAW